MASPSRVRTPTVLQMEAVECGAAALAIILGYFGRYVSLEELRYQCGVSRDGTKASNIVMAAQHYGLKAKGLSIDVEALRQSPMPMIIFWNFNHFVVLEGFEKRKVYLNDPATGPRSISLDEFEEAFTGVTLVMHPGPDFKAGGKRPGVLSSLMSRLRGAESALALVVCTSLALVVPGLCVPTFQRVFADYFLIEQNFEYFSFFLVGVAAVAVVRMALQALQQGYLLKMQTRLAISSTSRFFYHVLRLPVSFFTQRYAGEVAGRVDLNDRVARLASSDLATTVLSTVTVVLYAIVMAQYSLLLTLIAILAALVNAFTLKSIMRDLRDASQRLLLDRGKMVAAGIQGLQMIDDLRLRGTDAVFFERLAGYQARVVNADQDMGRRRLIMSAIPTFLGSASLALILVVGGHQVMIGGMTVGMLLAYQSLMAVYYAPITSLMRLGGQMQDVQGFVGRLDDVLAQPLDAMASRTEMIGAVPFAETKASSTPSLKGAIEFRDVTFGYAPLAPPLLDKFSITVCPGERVALVGSSGSGKSTIGRLLTGLHQPWSGEIRLDGMLLQDVPIATLRRSMAFVDQEVVPFQGTVRENIALWDQTLTEEVIVQAAQDAAIHDEIARRPQVYDSPVLSGGRNFSGGELQRLEMARALAGNPSILVLDEATSALDAVVEEKIMGQLRRRGCTLFIIAHRLRPLRLCDRVVVLDRGRVTQDGRFSELAAADGPFRTMLEA
ncbi:MAG: NHLP family bacteriocin export ABC transporter peptidase/permease/ATPase subunit [Rhodospirillaceae bacterium]